MGGLRDSINLASRLTWKRAVNIARITSSYQRSRRTRQPAINGMPISIAIEPTTSCNLRCPQCPSGLRSFTRPTGMLQPALYSRIIDELAPTLTYLTFYFQGEPYLNPGFLDMVGYASARGIYTATSTNAHYLTEDMAVRTVQSGLDRLIISIDGTTQEAYEAYRVGGSLQKVLAGAQHIVSARKRLKSKTPHIIFQFLVVARNEHQIPELSKLAKQAQVDQVLLKTAQIYDYKNGSDLIPRSGRYSRYKKIADGTWSIKNQLSDHCWKMWHSCVITWNGSVVPCCFDKDAQFTLGDVKENSFSEVWNSEAYNHFRRSLFTSRKDIEICKNCTEGSSVFA